MKNFRLQTFRLVAPWMFACQLFAMQALAQWSTDPNVNNPICTATNIQSRPNIVSDGAGGAIITWGDARSGTNSDIYAQRINAAGAVQWTANGVAISVAANNQNSPTIVSDGVGGAIITWYDIRIGGYDIYAQRINAAGVVQWTADGVAICTAAQVQDYPTIVSDGAGGAIITWHDFRSGTFNDIYAQRINAAGVVQWTANGVVISTAANNQDPPLIVSDGASGAIITWQDYRSTTVTDWDIYAQRINAAGVVQWTANGVVISTAANNQDPPLIVSDGASGAIITWQDYRGTTVTDWDIYAQRINADSVVQWTANGRAICTATNVQTAPTILSDGAGGAIIAWEDNRSFTSDIYAQRINAAGVVQWTTNGVAVSTASGYEVGPTIVSDGAGGAIIAWYDSRSGTSDIYAQRINADSVVQWTANGVAVCTAAGSQIVYSIVSDGAGGAIIIWYDYRSTTSYDIYAQRINAAGVVQWTANGVAVSTPPDNQVNPTSVSDGAGGAIITWWDNGGLFDIHASRVFSDGGLPIQLASFTSSTVNGSDVLLHWTTSTEINNYGFEIERKPLPNTPLTGEGTKGWGQVGFVEGNGTSNAPKEYSFRDKNRSAGRYAYRLKQIDRDGKFEYSQSVEVAVIAVPAHFSVDQNYPNPFNPSTTIRYSLPTSSRVRLTIFNVLGQVVDVLVNEEQSAGWKEAKWNANAASGIYFYRIGAIPMNNPAGNFVQERKMLLLK